MPGIHEPGKCSVSSGRGLVLLSLVWLMVFFYVLPAASAEHAGFTLNSADTPPYSSPDYTGIYDIILQNAFDQVGVQIIINHLASSRSIENVEIGIDDGEFARIKGLSSTYRNILLVDEKLVDFAFTAFAKDKSLLLEDWNSLSRYNVAYLKGWKIYEKNSVGAKSVLVSSSEEELFRLLINDRVDIVLYERLRGLSFLEKNNIHGVFPLSRPLAVKGMYLYLNKRHAALITPLQQALKAVKATDEYAELVNPPVH